MVRSRNVSQSAVAEEFAEGFLYRLLQAGVSLLIVVRLLVPPEASVLGETLWITQLGMGLVLVWGWDAFRRSDRRVKLGWIDSMIWLVVLGHGLSTLWVLGGNGNQRSALNSMWEWIGLGISFFLLRQILRSRGDGRRLIVVMIAMMVLLAGYGLWQHYWELPRISQTYLQLLEEIENQPDAQTPATRRTIAELQSELAEMGVPQNATSRSLWENRLRSTEPFATFALANTLAGFLAAWLFVAMNFLRFQTELGRWRATFAWRDVGKLACLLIVGFCLVLTKSRTAWVGFAAGLCVWGSFAKFPFHRSWRYLVAGIVLVAVIFFGIATLSQGFDREVISEAPKSLAYRLEYWAGSWEVVKKHPWLGTGPGNFRQHYLKHKLPQSSEEIADPHNWIFDLWTSGGLLALVGFLAILGWAISQARRVSNEEEPAAEADASADRISAWEVGAGLAFPVVILAGWFQGEPWDSRPVWLLAGGIVVWWILRKNPAARLPRAGLLAGGLAMITHLLGAGGIEMPAITQTLLVMLAILGWAGWKPAAENRQEKFSAPKLVFLPCGLAAAAFVACLVTATAPVWYQNIYLLSGDAALSFDRNAQAAAGFYHSALEADPYSPAAAERLSELHFQLWQGNQSERDFEHGVQFGRLAIERDPVSHRGYRRLGNWYYQRALMQNSQSDAKSAAEYLSEAVARYPNSASLQAELALAFRAAGEGKSAQTHARRALELDEINRQAGHRDKFLPTDVRAELEE